jgi:hypothetical protein
MDHINVGELNPGLGVAFIHPTTTLGKALHTNIVYRASLLYSREKSHSQKRREPIGIRNVARGPLGDHSAQSKGKATLARPSSHVVATFGPAWMESVG